MQVTGGTLALRGGGTMNGTWEAQAGAVMNLQSAVYENTASTVLTGGGEFRVVGSGTYRVAVNQAIGVRMVLMTGGTLDGDGTVTFTGAMDWQAGTMSGNGRTVFAEGSVVTLSTTGGKAVRERRVDNGTTVAWTGGSMSIGGTHVWNNLPGSVLEMTGNTDAILWFAPVPVFNNQGTVRRGGASASNFDYNLNNAGLVQVTAGTLAFRQIFTQTGGELVLDGGNLAGNIAYAVSGGVVRGAGSLNRDLQLSGTAEVRPGGPLGRLSVAGTFTAAAGTRSVFQIGGTDPASTHDQLAATGALSLNGDLRIELAEGFVPAGQSFTLLTGSGRTGTFSATNAPAGYRAEVTYTANSVVMNLVETGATAPEITGQPGDREVDVGGVASFSVTATGSDLTYQWRRNGEVLEGRTGAELVIDPVRFADAGEYTVVVANGAGSETSQPATLTVRPTGIDSGLVARYAFDGDLADAVGARDGVPTGPIAYVSGARGDAVRLAGSSWMALGGSPAEPFIDGTRAFAVSFWIRPRALQGMVPVRLATAETEFAVYLGTQPGDLGAYYFGFRGQPAMRVTATEAYLSPNLYRWMHVTVEYRGGPKNLASSYTARFNGAEVPVSAGGVIGGSSNANEIGRNEAGFGNLVNGDLDEVRVYERSLSAADAEVLSADAPPPVPEILVQPPESLAVTVGSPINLTVSAVGPGLRYLWYRGETLLGTQDTPALSIPSAALADDGIYRVVVENDFGSATSGDVVVVVEDPGTPTGLLARYGFDGSLSTSAGGVNGTAVGPISYPAGVVGQAVRLGGASYLDFGNVPVVNEAQGFTVAYWFRPTQARTMVLHRVAGSVREFACSVGANPEDAGNLRLAVLFGFRGSLLLSTADRDLYLDSLLDEWHHYAFVFRGGDTSDAANYEFWFDGVQVPLTAGGLVGGSFNANAFGANPGGAAAAVGDLDEYLLYGRPLTGPEVASLAGVAAPETPAITAQPVGRTVRPGEPVTFSVAATGGGLSYQWRRNGINIQGATGPEWVVANPTVDDEGVYSVVISNTGGSTTSVGGRLWVIAPPAAGDFAGWFPFDGSVADSLGISEVAGGGTRIFLPGPRGQYLNFVGGDGLLVGENPSRPLVDFSRPFALSFWLYQRQLADLLPVSLAGADGDFVFRLGTGQAGSALGGSTVSFGFGGLNAVVSADAAAAVAANLGQWLQVALNYLGGSRSDPASYQLFLNGLQVALGSGGVLSDAGLVNRIGGGGVVGGLDDVRLYNRILAAAEVAGFSAGRPVLPPDLAVQPVDTANLLGGRVVLRAGVVGLPPFTFQWYRDGELLPTGTAAEFTIPSLTAGDLGTYVAVVGNANGSITSAPARVSVTLPALPGLASLPTGLANFITSASFLNASSGAFAFRGLPGVPGGGVRFTFNGGQTWINSPIGVTNDVNAVRLTGSVAYIGGTGGLLCISTNSGASWTPFVTDTRETFNALSFSTPTSGWAVGTGGIICRYDGRRWIPTPTGLTVNFTGVADLGNIAWAVGRGGIICRYNGTAWEPIDTGTTDDFNAVAFLDANFGLAVGSRGLICRYNGTAWVPVTSGTSATFRNVAIVDALTAYASGDNGLLCITRDGGLTWQPQGLGSAGDLGGVAANGGRVFLFGEGGSGFALTAPGQTVNLEPVISILSPTNGMTFPACFDIPIRVSVTDPDGVVEKVEIFRGQFKLAEITERPRPGQPYFTSFHTDALGRYDIVVAATDDRGAVAISDPVTIEVVPPPLDTAIAEPFNDLGFTLCYLGEIGAEYVLQGTTALFEPIEWTNLSTNAIPEPLLRITDPGALELPYRFYRFIRHIPEP